MSSGGISVRSNLPVRRSATSSSNSTSTGPVSSVPRPRWNLVIPVRAPTRHAIRRAAAVIIPPLVPSAVNLLVVRAHLRLVGPDVPPVLAALGRGCSSVLVYIHGPIWFAARTVWTLPAAPPFTRSLISCSPASSAAASPPASRACTSAQYPPSPAPPTIVSDMGFSI